MNFLRRWLKFLFAASDKEVNGIIALSFIVLLLLVARILVKNNDSNKEFFLTQEVLDSIVSELNPESISKKTQFKKPDHKIDPNKIEASQWIGFGLDSAIAFRIEKYVSNGGSFLERQDLLKIYGLPIDFYDSIFPFLLISKPFLAEKKEVENDFSHTNSETEKKRWEGIEEKSIDLNLSDSITFLKIKGIGPFRASTILKYRELLGGYYSLDQLFEVYGLDSIIVESISKYLSIDTALSPVKQLKINECDFKVLVHHPYLNYSQVQSIMNFRTQHNSIRLSDFQSFPFLTSIEKSKVIPYLSF